MINENKSIELSNLKIAIIGSGNVGYHLNKALSGKADIYLINSRSLENMPKNCDVAIICVKDDAIVEVAEQLKSKTKVLAHTSGSVAMDVLKPYSESIGVVYPLQTFSKDDEIDYNEIPCFIEASDSIGERYLSLIAFGISGNYHHCDSEKRKRLHLASVFACNFTNALYDISIGMLEENGFEKKHIMPLLSRTLNKLEKMTPAAAQTGPAKRKDVKTMETHLKLLKDKPDIAKIYQQISGYIISKN